MAHMWCVASTGRRCAVVRHHALCFHTVAPHLSSIHIYIVQDRLGNPSFRHPTRARRSRTGCSPRPTVTRRKRSRFVGGSAELRPRFARQQSLHVARKVLRQISCAEATDDTMRDCVGSCCCFCGLPDVSQGLGLRLREVCCSFTV